MTINKKDLMNTYIVNDNGGLLYLYMATCSSVGFHEFGEFDQDFYKGHKYVVCNKYSEPSEEGVLQGHYSVDGSLRELSWDDLMGMQLCREDTVKEDVEETTEWDGAGLPPVGTGCEAVFIDHEHKGYGEFLILGYYGDYVWMEYIGDLSNKSKHYTTKVDMVKFRKPESEAERVERERVNAIYDMCASVDNFTEESNFWAGKFYDAGYKKKCTLDKLKS